MTIYLWDGSSYDGHITVDQFRRAMSEGVVAFTHRLTRQFGALDTYAAQNLSNARTAGLTLLGAYAVTYTSGGDAQDELTVRYADQQVPWWRQFGGWFWQVDLERWSNDSVPASVGIAEAQQLHAGTGRQVALYASHSQYGDQLRGWDGPLWNADYTSRPAGTVSAMYPGDNWRPNHGSWTGGWAPYSGREPDLLQYTSSATIGGLTTCDASAYRGTLDQLRALLTGSASPSGGTVSSTNTDAFIAAYRSGNSTASDGQPVEPVKWEIRHEQSEARVEAALAGQGSTLAGLVASVTALTASVHALASGGTSVDTAAVIAHIDQVAQAESGTVAALHDQIASLTAQLTDLRTKLAAAAQAEAGALAQ
jgi:hypothetical protein